MQLFIPYSLVVLFVGFLLILSAVPQIMQLNCSIDSMQPLSACNYRM